MVALPGFHYNKDIPRSIAGNLHWRAKVHKEVIRDPSFAETVWQACADDPIFYLSGFCYTYNPRPKSGNVRNPFSKLPFILYEFQEDAVKQIVSAIYEGHDLLVEKSREMGASWICLATLEWLWHFSRDNVSVLLGSRNEKYVDDPGNPKCLFWKVDYLLDTQPVWLLPGGYNKADHRRKLHFLNPETGSAMDGESTTGEFARGDRRTAILLDEFAAVSEGHHILDASQHASDCRLFNSTPQGRANAYYDMAQTEIRKLRMHWSVHPNKNIGLYTTDSDGRLKVLDEEYGLPDGYVPILDGKLRSPWYDDECRRTTSPMKIAQELDIDYLGSGNQYFNPAMVQDLIRDMARDRVSRGTLDYTSDTAEPIEFAVNDGGKFEMWIDHTTIHPFDKFVVACDISAGTGASNSAMAVYNTRTNEKVGQYVDSYIRPEEFAKLAVATCKLFNSAFLIWENNGVGTQFGGRVIDIGYPDIYMDLDESSRTKKITKKPGWASTRPKKLILFGEYREALSRKMIVNKSKDALDECMHYVYGDDGGVEHDEEKIDDPSGAKANHGDRVMADALAWRGLSQRPSQDKDKPPEAPYGSLAWRQQRKKRDNAMNGRRELLWSKGWRP